MNEMPYDEQALIDEWETLPTNFIFRTADEYEDETMCIFEGLQSGVQCPFAPNLYFREGEVTLWGGINGHGKALDLNTPIPTPDGWKKLGDIHPGDSVFDENGKPCRVVAETEIQYDRPCYLVGFNDGTEIVADANHEWLTDDYKSRLSRAHAKQKGRLEQRPVKRFGTDQTHKRTFAAIRTTQQIAETLIYNNKTQRNKTNHSVNVCRPIQYPERELPISPYTLGAWLGNGTGCAGEITTPDAHVIERIRADGFEVSERSAKMRYGILGLQVRLRENNLLNNKHVPNVYLTASDEQRLALLQGLMDSDGHCSQHTCEFCSTNRQLAEAVYELAASFGCIVHLIVGRAKFYGKDCGEKYRVTFTTSLNVFSLPRKKEKLPASTSFRTKQRFIVKCEPCDSVPVKCIQVDSPSHLYLASRSFVPTHNSLITGQLALQLADAGERVAIMSFEMLPKFTWARMIRQWLGGKTKDVTEVRRFYAQYRQKLFILDHVGAIDPRAVLGAGVVASTQYKCKHLLIDNLAKVVAGEDDLNAQKNTVQMICDLAHRMNVHVHLIHHVRKGKSESDELGKFDFKGSGAIGDQVDNQVIVQRNRDKEKRRQENILTPVEDADSPDTFIRVCKQRNGDWEGNLGLWFNRKATAFCVDSNRITPWGGHDYD